LVRPVASIAAVVVEATRPVVVFIVIALFNVLCPHRSIFRCSWIEMAYVAGSCRNSSVNFD